MYCSAPGCPVLHCLPKFAKTHVHWVDYATQPSHPLSSSSPAALSLSQHQGLFQWVGSLRQVAKLLELQLQPSVLPMNIQGWFPLGWTGWISLQSKGHKSLLQHHSSKASVLRHSAFFTVQLSHPYMTTGKTIALTRWTFVGKVMSLLFNMLSRLLITFLPKQASFNFLAAITICSDFGAPQNKVCHYFHCFPIYLPWSDGTRCHDLRFLNVEF